MKPNVIVLSTSPGDASRSRAAAEILVKFLERRGVQTELVDVRELPPVWVTGAGLPAAGSGWVELGEKVKRADAVVFAAPVYFYTVGSPARIAAELLGSMFTGKPVALLTAAGSSRSQLAHRDFLSSLNDEVSAQIIPKTVQVTGADFDESGLMSSEIQQRIAALADAVADAAYVRTMPVGTGTVR